MTRIFLSMSLSADLTIVRTYTHGLQGLYRGSDNKRRVIRTEQAQKWAIDRVGPRQAGLTTNCEYLTKDNRKRSELNSSRTTCLRSENEKYQSCSQMLLRMGDENGE